MTQEALAKRSDLSPDTVRRLERNAFLPNIGTVIKLCMGLDLRVSTFFAALELCENDVTHEAVDLLATRSPGEQTLAMNLLRVLFANLDGLRDESIADDEPDGARKIERT